jgi:hypothetical protein
MPISIFTTEYCYNEQKREKISTLMKIIKNCQDIENTRLLSFSAGW